MGKCLVTKYNEVVNNASLRKVGELIMNVYKQSSPTYKSQGNTFTFNKESTITIIGDGYFTDSTLTENYGKTKSFSKNVETEFWLSNGDYQLSIDDKYALVSIKDFPTSNSSVTLSEESTIGFDISELKYSNSLTYLRTGVNSSGNLEALQGLTNLTYLRIDSSNITGDLVSIKNLNYLSTLSLTDTDITGDISYLKGMKKLTVASFSNTSLFGDISSLADCTLIKELKFSSTGIYGDIDTLKNLNSLVYIDAQAIDGLTGNILSLPKSMQFFTNQNGNSTFTCSGTRSSDYTIIALREIKLGDADAYLNAIVECTKSIYSTTHNMFKTIAITGSKTSASDDAVSVLKSKGYIVNINGVDL